MVGCIVIFGSIAVFVGYKWLARDEVNRTYECTKQRGRSSTCSTGETVNMLGTYLASALVLACVVALVVLLVSRRSRPPAHSS